MTGKGWNGSLVSPNGGASHRIEIGREPGKRHSSLLGGSPGLSEGKVDLKRDPQFKGAVHLVEHRSCNGLPFHFRNLEMTSSCTWSTTRLSKPSAVIRGRAGPGRP